MHLIPFASGKSAYPARSAAARLWNLPVADFVTAAAEWSFPADARPAIEGIATAAPTTRAASRRRVRVMYRMSPPLGRDRLGVRPHDDGVRRGNDLVGRQPRSAGVLEDRLGARGLVD